MTPLLLVCLAVAPIAGIGLIELQARLVRDGLWATLAHTKQDGLCEADSVHNGLDLDRSLFKQTNFRDGIRQPVSGHIEHDDATKRGELIEESLELGQGPEQLGVADHRPDEDKLDRPVAEHLKRQAQIAALCV
jgi:hypothetical protein